MIVIHDMIGYRPSRQPRLELSTTFSKVGPSASWFSSFTLAASNIAPTVRSAVRDHPHNNQGSHAILKRQLPSGAGVSASPYLSFQRTGPYRPPNDGRSRLPPQGDFSVFPVVDVNALLGSWTIVNTVERLRFRP